MTLQTSEKGIDIRATNAAKPPELVRGLNVWHATSIVAGTIIGFIANGEGSKKFVNAATGALHRLDEKN